MNHTVSGAETSAARLQGIDLMRAAAILAVVVIHTRPFERAPSHVGEVLDLATVLNQLARFAVPFFFTVSGYFWAAKVARQGSVWSASITLGRRILWLFFTWSLIYLLPSDIWAALELGAAGPVQGGVLELQTGRR